MADQDRLNVEEHGGGSGGPPLLFLHSAGGNRLYWPPGLRRLAGARTLAVDLPGHGASPPGDESTILALARRVEAWRRVEGVGPAVVIGHSMGAAIALTLALENPSAVAGLVLIGSGAQLRVNPALLDVTSRPETFERGVDQILEWSFAPEAPQRLVELVRRRMLETGPGRLHLDLLACNAFDVSERLSAIDVPTLLLVGSEDRMTPRRLSEALLSGIRGARLELIEGAGHMAMLEKPEVVSALLQGFLGEIALGQ